jgi:hypothetical protein
MREMERLNLLPAHQKARRMLEEIGEPIDPACLHSVQLALWAVKTGRVEADPVLLETLLAMTAWSPERIRAFFMIAEEGDAYRLSGWETAERAEHMATLILDEIEAKMVIHFPWYYDLC